ncbi:MAG TPA: aldo/keto reductase, partial [Candidatus Sulfotelmatobacter sp.]|nr:aldo/keto reductase [Candidatus Sulfotelmatobacter sp.]
AKKYNATPARISLAWVQSRPGITAPIASATNLDQLKDLIAATDLKLDAESVALLDRESA